MCRKPNSAALPPGPGCAPDRFLHPAKEPKTMSAAAFHRLALAAGMLFTSVWLPAHATTFIAQYVPPPTPSAPPPHSILAAGLAPGLHVFVSDGAIVLNNRGGSLSFNAGQFGFTGNSSTPPVIVPSNPGLKFTPPPAFSATSTASQPSSGKALDTVDCEVR